MIDNPDLHDGLSASPAPPSLRADDDSDLGRAREVKGLRTRIAELERQAALRGDKIIPSLREKTDSKHKPAKCGFHPQVTVDFTSPVVECSVCETPLDPIEVLRDFVREERRFTWAIESLREERSALERVVAAFKKERAKVRAAARKDGVTNATLHAVEFRAAHPKLSG